MANLTPADKARMKERAGMADSSFAIPEKRKYRIDDKSHARLALAMAAAYANPKEKARVRAAVKRKYPSIKQGGG